MGVDDLLSPEERDALLAAPAPPPAPNAVREWRLGQTAGPDNAPASLHHLFERYVAGLAEALSALVEQPVEIAAQTRTRHSGQEFLHALPLRVVLHALSFDPPRPAGWIAADGALASALVERLFGGRGRMLGAADRELGATELRLASAALRVAVQALQPAFEPRLALKATLGPALDPQLPGALDVGAPLLACLFEVRVGALGGLLRLGLPAEVLEALTAAETPAAGDAAWCNGLRAGIKAAPLPVHATLARLRVPLRRVLALRVGEVIELDGTTGVVLAINDRPLAVGELGSARGQLAVRVHERIAQPPA